MDFSTVVIDSNKIFLADVSEDFKRREGDVPAEERAWVTVRQATQADNIRIQDVRQKREVKYGYEPGSQGASSVSRVYYDNPARLRMQQAWLTIVEIGNFTLNGKPPFAKLPTREMMQKDFETAWGALPPFVADALSAAVFSVNVDWLLEGE